MDWQWLKSLEKKSVSEKEALNLCKQITKKFSKSFYFASKFLPSRRRQAVYALYAFCRYTDSLVDDNPQLCKPKIVARELKAWKNKVKDAFDKNWSDHFILNALLKAKKTYQIEDVYFFELIEGVEMDLYKNRYQDFQELARYCYLVAGVVGVIMAKILGAQSLDAFEKASDLGKAMQLTNILRDIEEDWQQRQRIYLPLQDLQKFGYTTADLDQKLVNQPFIDLVQDYTKKSRSYYQSAKQGVVFLKNKRSRFVVKLSANLYAKILDKIKQQDYNVFEHRASTGYFEKLLILFESMVES